MNRQTAVLIAAAIGLSGCLAAEPPMADLSVMEAGTPSILRGLDLPSAADPHTEDPMQTHHASWAAGIRGPACGTDLPNPCCNGDFRRVFDAVGDGIVFDRFAIDPDTWGLPARATVWAALPTTEGTGLHFVDGRGRVLGGGHTWMDGPASNEGSIQTVVPHGAVEGVFWSCVSGPMNAWYQAGPHYETSHFDQEHRAAVAVGAMCPARAGVRTTFGSTEFHAESPWTIPANLSDGTPAKVSRVEVRLVSATVRDGFIRIQDAAGRVVAAGAAPLITDAIKTPGTYTVVTEPCGAAAGVFHVRGMADLVPARPAAPASACAG